jgi:chemotaxis protein MotB
MALSRRSNPQRFTAMIWPGFVDAMTSLLLILMFVLTIFMVVQSVLRETITTQDTELLALTTQVSDLSQALSLETAKTAELNTALQGARDKADTQASLIATLTGQIATQNDALTAAQLKITDYEAQVANLLAGQAQAETQLAEAQGTITAQDEAAKLATARREALEALLEELRQGKADTETKLSEAETAHLADAAALAALRDKLKGAEDEITAMTLSLEASRKKAEDTLTLLAAAEAAKKQLELGKGDEMSRAEKEAALRAVAEQTLASEKAASVEAQRKVALLNEQVTALRGQLSALQAVLDESAAKDAAAKVQVENLGGQLNAALAQVAAEQRRRAELEEKERKRLEEEAKDLTRYRSEFFGKLSKLLEGREGVRVVGDRFVFSSEVLFQPGSAELLPEGRAQIAGVVATLTSLSREIPSDIDWILRVDGHTDNVPLSGNGLYADNWELSQARALSVVRYMQNQLGFPPNRMAATGFGEYRPVATGDSADARAQNRRIELKLTER